MAKESKVDDMGPSMVAELKEVFALFDKNADGSISAKELGDVLHELNHDFKPEQLQAMIKKVDTNGDGEIDFDEFLAMMNSGGSFESDSSELKEAFHVFDHDGDGEISASELMRIFTLLGINIDPETVEYMMKSVDENHDGVIDFAEFQKMMSDGPGA